ncbi:hypothetical protein Micbo1qcDRAFT_53056 [Microdochium bolleyi]|uniref:Uncharacterized protein n=1 Tax=Microdochium bolleyi TaxID=196109 RepID=A0A136J7C3_9PEZI|nr:hypothetical protein Micbo1qcDRAFT_53056 [Microdochium bolleyi]
MSARSKNWDQFYFKASPPAPQRYRQRGSESSKPGVVTASSLCPQASDLGGPSAKYARKEKHDCDS